MVGSGPLFKIRLKIFPRLSVILFYTSDLSRTLAKSAYQNINLLISQPKIMLSTKTYVVGTFEHPKQNFKLLGKK